MKIFITGGAGYTGSNLVNRLLEKNYKITVCDTFWFGDKLPKNKNLKKIKCDINNLKSHQLKNHDVIIHLASIANDPGSELNPKLSWETIALGTLHLCNLAKKNNIKKFIYASSGSVYGVKKEKKVVETSELEPISEYNKAKMTAERVIMSFKESFNYTIIRPATVCGISKRMRLDVSVNMFSFQAFKNNKITIFGGNQIRPNIHIDDLISIYILSIEKPIFGIYNAGFENISIKDIAKKVRKNVKNTKIVFFKSNDKRSYRLSSNKLLRKGFKPKKNVDIAIKEMIGFFNSKKFRENDKMFTVKHMVKLKLNKN
jgi:nucleoside-diphosphate-sugar epimerase